MATNRHKRPQGTTNHPMIGLCNRCEHRTRYRETGTGPRYECGVLQGETVCCYNYRPVLPVLLRKHPLYRKRGVEWPACIAPRMTAVRVAEEGRDMVAIIQPNRRGEYLTYWHPAEVRQRGATP